MTKEEIKKLESTLPFYIGCWQDYTEEQRQLDKELRCRKMINTLIEFHFMEVKDEIWDVDKKRHVPITEKILKDRYLIPYKAKGDTMYALGLERVKELVDEQVAEYKQK